jgi:pyruvate-ferredoxin/flavodoxin oxidoreductase
MKSEATTSSVPYPGIPVTTNGNQLVSYYTEARLADAGIFYPITPSTEMGENFQLSFAQGQLNVFGRAKVAIETEGEHAAQGGAIAYSLTGKRVVNFTSGQGVAYGIEQYYHAPGKLSTMVLEVAARAMTKHALNVHCGHDDIYLALDTGWIILFGKDAQQASDQALILRRVTELALTPGINGQDGFLTSHLERTFLKPEAGLIRDYLGHPEDLIDCPTPAQRELFGEQRRRVPAGMDLARPAVLGTVQNQEHYMQGVAARRHHFVEPILGFLEDAYAEFERLTGRAYGLLSANQCADAETVFLSIGSAAENVDAAVDYIRASRGEKVGSIHLNVIRPFPEKAVIEALRGKKRVIVLERIDDQTAGENPLCRDIRTALGKALENHRGAAHADLPAIEEAEMPRIFSATYGLGSRDFRPEGILGAYEYATGEIAREDGRRAVDGESFFYVGIPHPYAVQSAETPSLLPEGAIAIRFHSIGGWGMITTGKNMGEILGALGSYVAHRDEPEAPVYATAVHISANPKYGSEKKGAPTAYFLVAAGERVRVNCDLHHVDVVLCCDPKVFLHTNPLSGLNPGGAFVWESNETSDEGVWSRIPANYRQEIIDKGIRIFALNGFAVARAATERPDLQYRMQGNSFLGAFFRVSSFLSDHQIPEDEFLTTVRAQYVHKFGRFGDAVVESNMTVMNEGYSQVREIKPGAVDAPDRSSMRGAMHLPSTATEAGAAGDGERDPGLEAMASPPATGVLADSMACSLRPALFARSDYDAQFRSDYGYDVPSTPRAATGAMAAGTGATIGKYVARRLVPKFIAENCTQCMACITSCPDTALPNTAQDLQQILRTLFSRYVDQAAARDLLLRALDAIEAEVRAEMVADAAKKQGRPRAFAELVLGAVRPRLEQASALPTAAAEGALVTLSAILETLPIAYANVRMIFSGREKKQPGSGGIFAIFVSDHCKGCGECVEECGDHEALVMVEEDEDIYAAHETAIHFLDLLPETPRHYLGQYDAEHPEESKAAALHFHLMQQNNYRALVSGDGACAGCGEKSVLRAATTITEATMRPIFHRKAERLTALAEEVADRGLAMLRAAESRDPRAAATLRTAITHLILGFGGEDREDTAAVIAAGFDGSDEMLLETLRQVLATEAFNHRKLQAIEGGPWNGMSVMAMSASTGCNTVYGSTHPNNPHPYPWVNSLFQDGATVGWLLAEGFMAEHIRRSVLPERLARLLLKGEGLSESLYRRMTLLTDASLTDLEVLETPKVWAIGGDGAFGDIGYQNLSKAVLQNRPNLQILMLDTQVYSNTGGQNSDSSPMPGGFDMNQAGEATEGKLTEKKGVAESFTSGHGSPYVAQVSMGSAATLFRSVLDGLFYRGTAFFQCFTTCQPEHGVGDDVAALQAQRARDSRGVPEFIFDPQRGETYGDCFSLKGNPNLKGDWQQVTVKATKERYAYTVAHWAHTEARFRRHFHKVDEATTVGRPSLETLLALVAQNDVTHRYFQDPEHRAFIPEEGSWMRVQGPDGRLTPIGISRQLVLFCVERRKSWRMLQSKAGIRNLEQAAQARLITEYEQGKIPLQALRSRAVELLAVARKLVQSGEKGALLEMLD